MRISNVHTFWLQSNTTSVLTIIHISVGMNQEAVVLIQKQL